MHLEIMVKLKQEDFKMSTEMTNTVQNNESKADKFVRLGESRVNKVMEAIGRIEHLANRACYDCFTTLQKGVSIDVLW